MLMDTVPLFIGLPALSVTLNSMLTKSPAVPFITLSHGVNITGAGLTSTGTVECTSSVPFV